MGNKALDLFRDAKANGGVVDPYKSPDQYNSFMDLMRRAGMPVGSMTAEEAKKQIDARTKDPFDSMIKEASLAQIRAARNTGRKSTFVVGPRGLEGPVGNAILGGGTSLLGS